MTILDEIKTAQIIAIHRDFQHSNGYRYTFWIDGVQAVLTSRENPTFASDLKDIGAYIQKCFEPGNHPTPEIGGNYFVRKIV